MASSPPPPSSSSSDPPPPSSSSSSDPPPPPSDDGILLITRGPAWGLPTACPLCLPSFVYLKLSEANFSIFYNDTVPDSEDLPTLEYREKAVFSGEGGGIMEFLKAEDITDLDAGFSNEEIAQIRALSALVESHLQNALLCELWSNENKKIAQRIYFKDLPWPINKILHWKQQMRNRELLGLRKFNMESRTDEIARKATEAYESFSNLLNNYKYFMKTRPSSVDALFLSHALFVLHVPLENSLLKGEFQKYPNLIKYAEDLRTEFLEGRGTTPIAKSIYATPKTTANYTKASARTRKEHEPKERSEKTKLFKQRTKFFLGAQAVAVLAFAYIWGVSLISDLEDYADYENE